MAVPPQALAGTGLLVVAPAYSEISRLSSLLSGLSGQLIHSLAHPGPWAAAVSVLIMVADTFLPIPGGSLGVANGAIFGFWGGLAVSWTGVMSSAVLAFGIGRVLPRRPPAWGRVRRLLAHADALLERGARVTLVVRFIPLLPFTVFNVALGRAHIGWWTFLWTTALGILPTTVALVAIGYGAVAAHGMVLWWACAPAGLIPARLALRPLAGGRSPARVPLIANLLALEESHPRRLICAQPPKPR